MTLSLTRGCTFQFNSSCLLLPLILLLPPPALRAQGVSVHSEEAPSPTPHLIRVQTSLASPTPAGSIVLDAEVTRAVESSATAALEALGMPSARVRSVIRHVSAAHRRPVMARAGGGLAGVGSIIAVYSCKGGVGKSTVAVNLAAALSRLGARVGILDADVAGPSLPTMVALPADRAQVFTSGDPPRMSPVEFRGMACMSYGWVAPRDPSSGARGGVAPMRGPRVASVVSQMALGTAWGELDHLIVDMPPGTGDIHLTLGQVLPITAAVMVTTPQTVALVDVEKGMQLFAQLSIPTAALVMNMSYFDGADGVRYYPLGDGLTKLRAPSGILSRWRVPVVVALPMEATLSEAGDAGVPAVFQLSEQEVAAAAAGGAAASAIMPSASLSAKAAAAAAAAAASLSLASGAGKLSPASAAITTSAGLHVGLARAVAEFVQARLLREAVSDDVGLPATGDAADVASTTSAILEGDDGRRTRVQWDARTGRIALLPGGAPHTAIDTVHPRTLRLACKCAACVDEHTGQRRLNEAAVPQNVAPTSLRAQGNYGVAVSWSDGHTSSIYSTQQLRELSRGAA